MSYYAQFVLTTIFGFGFLLVGPIYTEGQPYRGWKVVDAPTRAQLRLSSSNRSKYIEACVEVQQSMTDASSALGLSILTAALVRKMQYPPVFERTFLNSLVEFELLMVSAAIAMSTFIGGRERWLLSLYGLALGIIANVYLILGFRSAIAHTLQNVQEIFAQSCATIRGFPYPTGAFKTAESPHTRLIWFVTSFLCTLSYVSLCISLKIGSTSLAKDVPYQDCKRRAFHIYCSVLFALDLQHGCFMTCIERGKRSKRRQPLTIRIANGASVKSWRCSYGFLLE